MFIIAIVLGEILLLQLHGQVRCTTSTVFFDSYADCFSRNNVVNLDDGDRVIVGSGSGEPFDTLICGITFKATTRNHRLCAIVKKMDIDRCDLNLTVYAKPSAHAHGSPIVSYHCHSGPVLDEAVCGIPYLTIRVKKAYIGRADYDVLLEVSDSSIPKFDEGSGIFPIWAIVAISVILMVITVAASIVYLHRRRRRVSVYSACWRRRTGTIEQTGDVDLVQL